MKLRTRLMIMLFSIIFISLGFLGLVIFKYSQRILFQNTLNNLKTLSIMIEARVNDVYERYREQLQIAVRRLALYQALDNYYADKSPEQQQALVAVLKKFVPVEQGREDMYFFEPDGRLLAATNSFFDGQYVLDHPFFKKGLQGEFIDFVKKSPGDKFSDQLFLSGVVKPKGQTAGVLLIVLKRDILSEITATELGIGTSEDILLAKRNANGDAEFIAHRRFQNDAQALTVIPKERTDVPMTLALRGEEVVLNKGIDYRGHSVFAATRYIAALDIGLVVKIDRSEFARPVDELKKVVMIFGGIIMFFTMFMAFIIARSLTDPIEKLSHDADRISSGDFTPRFLSHNNLETDEIGVLSRSVLAMSDKLIEANKGLEKEVAVRTKELGDRLAELELVNKVTTGRELQMIELKKRINELSRQLNQPEPYDLAFITGKNS